jgi:large subunit ribosomal protein L10
MPKTREEKKKIVNDLVDKLNRMKSAVFVNFSGLKVKEVQKLRELSWQEGVDYEVVKKTLSRIALKESGINEIEPKNLEGNLAIAFGYTDEIVAPKLIANFSKNNEGLKILGGILEKKFIKETEIKALANLPSRKELLSQLLRVASYPLSGFVNVLEDNLRAFIRVLNAIKEAKS